MKEREKVKKVQEIHRASRHNGGSEGCIVYDHRGLKDSEAAANDLFPLWERAVPMGGMANSHNGNDAS